MDLDNQPRLATPLNHRYARYINQYKTEVRNCTTKNKIALNLF